MKRGSFLYYLANALRKHGESLTKTRGIPPSHSTREERHGRAREKDAPGFRGIYREFMGNLWGTRTRKMPRKVAIYTREREGGPGGKAGRDKTGGEMEGRWTWGMEVQGAK